jgi:hypothetical protein
MNAISIDDCIRNLQEHALSPIQAMPPSKLAELDVRQYVAAFCAKHDYGPIEWDTARELPAVELPNGSLRISLPVKPGRTVELMSRSPVRGRSFPIHLAYSTLKFDTTNATATFESECSAADIKKSRSIVENHVSELNKEIPYISQSLNSNLPGIVQSYVNRAKAEIARLAAVEAEAGIKIIRADRPPAHRA